MKVSPSPPIEKLSGQYDFNANDPNAEEFKKTKKDIMGENSMSNLMAEGSYSNLRTGSAGYRGEKRKANDGAGNIGFGMSLGMGLSGGNGRSNKNGLRESMPKG